VEQHLHLQGREVLNLVDGDVPVSQRPVATPAQGAHAQLPGAQQQRVVFGVEPCLHFRLSGEMGIEGLVGASVRLDEAPDLVARDLAGRFVFERLLEKRRLGEDAGPVVEGLLRVRRSSDALHLSLEGLAEGGV
jgi:hypothetical protein